MQISLRSQLIAGTAAVVGAGAIAMTPVTPAVTLPSISVPTVAQVALAGFDSPLSELLLTVGVLSENIFDGANIYPAYEWEPYVGALPEFIYTALPIISQLGFNGSAYIGGSIDSLGTSAYILSEAVWNLPGAVITAAQQAIGGDIPGAITTLTNATLVPLQDAGTTALGALTSVVTGVVTNLTNVVGVLPGIATGLVNTLIGSAQVLVNAVVNIATQTIGALTTLDFETAWNTVVDGLLGPEGADGSVTSSIPGSVLALTVGPGVGELPYPQGYVFPSLRMWSEQSQLQIANALGASYPVPAAAEAAPAAAVSAAPAAEAAPTAAAVADVADVTDVEVARPSAGDASGSAAADSATGAGSAADAESAGDTGKSAASTDTGSSAAGGADSADSADSAGADAATSSAGSDTSAAAKKPAKQRAERSSAKAASDAS
ncbi:MAG: hypothetical protein ACKOB8_04615 [Mycobacterium sp.]